MHERDRTETDQGLKCVFFAVFFYCYLCGDEEGVKNSGLIRTLTSAMPGQCSTS